MLIWQAFSLLTELMIDYGTDSKCAPERAVFLSGRDEIWIQLRESQRICFLHSVVLLWPFVIFQVLYLAMKSHLLWEILLQILGSKFNEFDHTSGPGALFFIAYVQCWNKWTAHHSCAVLYLFKRFWLECSEILTQNQFHIFHIPIWMRWCVCWAGNIAFQYQIANTSKLTAGYSLVSCNPWIKIIHLFVCWHGFMWLRQFLSLGLFVMSCLKIK